VSRSASPPVASLLLTGLVSRYAVLAANIATGVVLMPFTLRHLGVTDYGLWMLVGSLTAYFQLFDLGYGNGVVRHVTAADARGDTEAVNAALSTFAVVYGGIGAATAAVIAVMIAAVVPRFPHLAPVQIRTAQVLLALTGLRIAIGFPMSVFGAITNARQRFALNNTVAVVTTLLNAAVTYVVLSRGHGLVLLVACTTALHVCSYGAYAWTATVAFPELRLRVGLFSRGIVTEITAFSAYFFIVDVAVQIGYNLDNVVVGAFLGTAAIAVYAIALRLADYQRQLCSQVNALLFPVVVRLRTQARKQDLREMMTEGTRLSVGLVVGLTICLVGFGRPLVEHWIGSGFDEAIPPLIILAVTGIVLVGQGPVGSVLLGSGRHRYIAVASIVEATTNLALSLILVRRFGILGVALGTAIPVWIVNLGFLVPAGCRTVEMSVASFGRAVLSPAAIAAVPAIAVCVLLRTGLAPGSLLTVVIEGGTVGAVYTSAFTAALGGGTRSHYAAYISRACRAIFT
jgi:O-antigen/teichoic acid export membrane protein